MKRSKFRIRRRFIRTVILALGRGSFKRGIAVAALIVLVPLIAVAIHVVPFGYAFAQVFPQDRPCGEMTQELSYVRERVDAARMGKSPRSPAEAVDEAVSAARCFPDRAEFQGLLGDALQLPEPDDTSEWEYRLRLAMSHRAYHRAAKLEPTNALWFKSAGEAWIAAGAVEDAVADMEEAFRLYPDDDKTAQDLSILYLKLDRHEDAQEVLETYLSAESSDRDPAIYAEMRLALGRLYSEQGRVKEAIELVQWATEYMDEAVSSRARETYTGCPYQAIGKLYGKVGRYDMALDSFLKADELYPKVWKAQVDGAIRAYRYGRFEEADRFIKRAMKLDTSDPCTYGLEALILLAMDRDAEARSLINDPKLTPGVFDDVVRSPYALVSDVFWGHWALKNKHFGEAERHFSHVTDRASMTVLSFKIQAVTRTPTWRADAFLYEMALLGMGWTRSAQGRHEDAINYYSRILAAIPQHYFGGLGYATSLSGLGRNDEVETVLTKMARYYPDNPYITNQLGVLALNRGDTGEAESKFNKAASSGVAAYACPYEGLGIAFLRENRVGEAESMLQKAIDMAPDRDAKKYTALAEIRLAQGRNDDAKKLVQRALTNIPGDPEATALLTRLSRSKGPLTD